VKGAALVVAMLIAVSVLYAGAVGGYLTVKRPGMALCFVGYVIANIGLIWDALSQQ